MNCIIQGMSIKIIGDVLYLRCIHIWLPNIYVCLHMDLVQKPCFQLQPNKNSYHYMQQKQLKKSFQPYNLYFYWPCTLDSGLSMFFQSWHNSQLIFGCWFDISDPRSLLHMQFLFQGLKIRRSQIETDKFYNDISNNVTCIILFLTVQKGLDKSHMIHNK